MQRIKITACLMAIAMSGYCIYLTVRPTRSSYHAALDRCVGARLAEEALQLTGGTGEIIAFTEAETESKSEMTVAQLQGFREALQKSTTTQLRIEAPPDYGTLALILSQEGLPDEVLTDLQAKHPQAKVVVSFLGGPSQRPKNQSKPGPKLIALIYAQAPNWDDLFAHENLTTVLWQRQGATALQVRPTDGCEKLLGAWFATVNRANLNEFRQ